jgi:hypothetical protein
LISCAISSKNLEILQVYCHRRSDFRVQLPRYWGRFRQVFTAEMEEEFAKHCLDMEAKLYGLTREPFMQLGFEFADLNGFSPR